MEPRKTIFVGAFLFFSGRAMRPFRKWSGTGRPAGVEEHVQTGIGVPQELGRSCRLHEGKPGRGYREPTPGPLSGIRWQRERKEPSAIVVPPSEGKRSEATVSETVAVHALGDCRPMSEAPSGRCASAEVDERVSSTRELLMCAVRTAGLSCGRFRGARNDLTTPDSVERSRLLLLVRHFRAQTSEQANGSVPPHEIRVTLLGTASGPRVHPGLTGSAPNRRLTEAHVFGHLRIDHRRAIMYQSVQNFGSCSKRSLLDVERRYAATKRVRLTHCR